MSKYPLTESLGVAMHLGHHQMPEAPGYTEYVRAADLERVLSQAPVVYFNDDDTMNEQGRVEMTTRQARPLDTHTARLLCVRPIVRDTAEAESLLRELIATHDDRDCGPYCDHYKQTIDRARKLLGEG